MTIQKIIGDIKSDLFQRITWKGSSCYDKGILNVMTYRNGYYSAGESNTHENVPFEVIERID